MNIDVQRDRVYLFAVWLDRDGIRELIRRLDIIDTMILGRGDKSTAALMEVRERGGSDTDTTAVTQSVDKAGIDQHPGAGTQARPVDTNSAALTHRSIPRPIGGAAELEGDIPALTAEAPAASADHMPDAVERQTSEGSPQSDAEDIGVTAGETAPTTEIELLQKTQQLPEEAEIPAVQSSEEGDDGHTVETARDAGAIPAMRPATSGKSGGVSDDASPAPTIASRLRALNAEHPELTTREVAAQLGMTLARVQSNSTVNKIRWADAVPQRPDRQGDIKRLHAEHPEWCDDDFAAVLGVMPGYVRATAVRLGIRLASRVSRKKAAAEPVQPVAPVSAPMPRVEPERPQQTARAPIAVRTSGSGSAVISRPMQRIPAGTRFNLRDDLGQWLHFGCEQMTTDRTYAWEGSADQLLACRKRFPLAADLAERVVEKEQRAA
ncbi:MAG: hypothetical protein ABI216_18390 [Devosia sp.]